jgi:hypothetical protein
VNKRVVKNVALSIQTLRIGRIRHNCVGRNEPPNMRVIVARIIIIQPQPVVPALAGIAVAVGVHVLVPAQLAPGLP